MSWYQIFYWLTVANGVRIFFTAIASIAGIYLLFASIAATGAFGESHEKTSWSFWEKTSKKLYVVFLIIFFISLCFSIFIPTKKDCMIIIAGGAIGEFVTNDSTARKIPGDLTYLIHMYLKKEVENLGDDEKKILQVKFQTPKEEFMEKIKKASQEQLQEFITRGDSSIIINIK